MSLTSLRNFVFNLLDYTTIYKSRYGSSQETLVGGHKPLLDGL
jgi:hypothetical protein